ncbi:hypothetical protein OIO90_006539 [Microbotryomycetes sp. JL221]|nr:hypothetical protein OIO90_006539 [Microbotryomycetes sp. JL221]
MSSSLLSRSLAQARDQKESASTRRASAGSALNARNSPYSRPEEGSWKHDKYDSNSSKGPALGRRLSSQNTSKSPKLKISNLHYEVSERELEFDRSGRSEGVAWVTFKNEDDATQAKEAFDGAMAKGQPITVQYDYALDRVSERGTPAPGTLLARLDAPPPRTGHDSRGSARGGSSTRGSRLTRGVERGVGSSERGARGGRGAARGGIRGGRQPRAAPKTSDDLDKELEAFMAAPAGDKAEAPAKTATDNTAAAAGDVEMSG